MAGLFDGDYRIATIYRNQWQSIAYPYQTNALSAEYKNRIFSSDDFLTIGFSSFYDQAGTMNLKTIHVMPGINYHKSLSRKKGKYLSAGFMTGLVRRQFDLRKLSFNNQYNNNRYNPSASTGESFFQISRMIADMSAGISFNSSLNNGGAYFIGASIWHFNNPTTGFLDNNISLPIKYQTNAGIKFPLNPLNQITAEANYLKQDQYEEIVAGLFIKHYLIDFEQSAEKKIARLSIGGGIAFRYQDAIIPQFSIEFNGFNLGISYDINISPLRTATQGQGGFEVSLSYQSFFKKLSSAQKGVICPHY